MVRYVATMGGVSVWINNLPFGHIDKEGFFTDSTVIAEFTRISSDDLRKIADRVDEFKARLRATASKGGK